MIKATAWTVAFFLVLAAPVFAIHETAPSETQTALPPADAMKLYDYITSANPYTSWKTWPGKPKLYKGTSPHGMYLTTYLNDMAIKSMGKKSAALADGSIVVKENYSSDKKLGAVTVMYKVKGYNGTAGDWFWAKYTPDGVIDAEGKVEMCIDCHTKKKANDYLFTGPLRR